MFDSKSIYALNKKDPEAIVYRDADGCIVRLTREDFPSEGEFLKWKAWSDQEYHAAEKREHVHANHTLSLSGLPDSAASVPSPEAAMLDGHSEQERQRLYALVREGMAACLTPTQRRRLRLYCMGRMSIEKIARLEHVRHQNVSKSIASARKKLLEFFKKQGAKPPI